MSAPRVRAAAMALGLGLVLAPALSGCIPSVDDVIGGVIQQGVESGIEGATGVDFEDGRVPADFPSEVPLADGDIVGGAGVTDDNGDKGWAVSLLTDRSLDEIRAQLESAGFAVPADAQDASISIPGIILVENGRYAVTVMSGQADGDRLSVQYVVIQQRQ